jgi:hypothetical protein
MERNSASTQKSAAQDRDGLPTRQRTSGQRRAIATTCCSTTSSGCTRAKDHYDFVLKMKERDVEVLELHDLLAETLGDAAARSWILDRRITANSVGRAVTRFVRPWLDEMPAAKLADHLIGGIAIEDLPKNESSSLLLNVLGGTSFLIPPIPTAAARPIVLDL